MSDLQLDLTAASQGTELAHDLMLTPSGDLALTQDAGAVQQAISQALKQLYQDWFLDLSVGIPYREQMLGTRGMTPQFEAVLQNCILAVPGVLGLLDWKAVVNRPTRTLAIVAQVQVTSGVVDWSATLAVG